MTAQPLWGEVDFFWGHHWYWQGQRTRSLDSLNRALERIPKAHHLARGEAELWWGLASQMSDQKEEAVRRLNRWLYDEQTPHPGRQTKLLGSLIFMFLLSAEFNDAAPLARQLHELATKHNNRYIRAWASYLQGHIHYYWNDLDTAARHFAKAVSDRYHPAYGGRPRQPGGISTYLSGSGATRQRRSDGVASSRICPGKKLSKPS